MGAPMPDPESVGFMAKMVGAMVALGGVFTTWFSLHKYTHAKIDKKAEQKTVDSLADTVRTHCITKDSFQQHVDQDNGLFRELSKEIGTQRGHVADIFKQMREMEKIGADRHIELLQAIHTGKRK